MNWIDSVWPSLWQSLWPIAPRHWVLLVFIAAALHAHLRGKVRFGLVRALTDFTVLIAPLNSLMVLFSKVGREPYLDPARFPELKVLQDHWQVIREEALALDDQGGIKAASGYTDLGFNSFFRTGWKRFYLKWYGVDQPSAAQKCPKTVALINQIPGIKAAMFASLPPGARLVRHRDPYAGSLRYHMGLITPNDPGCFIDVDGQRYHWKDGEVVMFDETYIHYAENTTQHPRIILFADIERPVYTPVVRWINRIFSTLVMKASATENEPGEKIGALNKAFGHFYKLRQKAKDFKATNRTGYYVGKWVLIIGLLLAIFY
ncbi:aspartyl/asparaginyl beta-hydroxylase domain-containing protein [Aquabacterium lacunae]|uniref:Aspartyl/asparaginyl beta-hydroxylase domain-containing protein n=1 Tax=Aquabacterium lacunae TaxID=2528630 RepID=A0A4Q9H206_9BURK|nr:aspartyl/asparaginyl beta-hydroxylase domain-containing protein [Aquabacterium lacunae]TBO31097.1 aspartyl/asparaginyl beta-hydroxylase domain-containing protein [Aquabacterium lacunae]